MILVELFVPSSFPDGFNPAESQGMLNTEFISFLFFMVKHGQNWAALHPEFSPFQPFHQQCCHDPYDLKRILMWVEIC